MTVNAVARNRPEVVPRVTFICVKSCVGGGNPCNCPRRSSGPSPLSGFSWLKVGVLRTFSHPDNFTFPSAMGTMKFSTLLGVNTSFALSLRAWISDASILSNSSMSATKMFPFQILRADNTFPRIFPGKTFFPNWQSLDRSLAEIG